MKKQLIFTLTLLLFSNISITMDTVSADSEDNSVETEKITIQITRKEYFKIVFHKKTFLGTLKKDFPGKEIDNLSEQEIQSAYVETPFDQIRTQLLYKNDSAGWQTDLHYTYGRLFDYLKNNEHLFLEVTYTPDPGKYIKGE